MVTAAPWKWPGGYMVIDIPWKWPGGSENYEIVSIKPEKLKECKYLHSGYNLEVYF